MMRVKVKKENKLSCKMEKWGFKFGKIVTKVKPEDLLKTWRIVTGDIVSTIIMS